MSIQLPNINSEVTEFLDKLHHPMRREIEALRICIVSANTNITENIKWNGPNYCIFSEDRVTMRIHPPTQQVQLIFHRGAKKQEQPKTRLIANTSTMLVWKENDRAVITFRSMQDIENATAELTAIINEWIDATM